MKDYSVSIERGRMLVTMNEKGKDGLFHSANCEYPFYVHKDGKAKRLSRKQTEEYLVNRLRLKM